MVVSSGSARRFPTRRWITLAAIILTACAGAPRQGPAYRYALEITQAPVAQRIHILELDLDSARIETTPGDASGGREYRARLTSAFAAEFGYLAAVNGGYFLPFRGGSPGGEDYYPHAGDPVNLSGAAIAFEAVISPVETEEDERVNAIICIEGAHVEILDGQTCASGTDHALAAGPRLIAGGGARTFDDFGVAYAAARHPRTAFGFDARARRAWFIVVDGRQAGFSEGASLAELTALFQRLGATDAINLDGGGSSTMVVAQDGVSRVVNSPIHTAVPGRERPVANHIGVRALR